MVFDWKTVGLVALAASPAVLGYTPTIDNSTAPNAQDVCPGYHASNVKHWSNKLTATLTLAGKACNAYGTDIESLSLNVEYQDTHRLAVTIQPTFMDAKNESYYVLDSSLVSKPKSSGYMPKTDLELNWGNSPSFWFEVQRKSTKEVLFTTQNSKLVFENQFIEFVTDLPQNYNVTGLGEHMHGLQLQPGFVATNWNADIGDPIDSNMYGTHAFLLDTRYDSSSSSSHGLWWRNSHGLEAVFGQQNLTWRAIGGSVELYFMDGPNPADVTMQYTQGVIGLPQMQQYWTLGLHQCHWGYSNWSDVVNNIDEYKKNDIPLETQWVDINYMDAYADFTTDPVNFPLQEGRELLDRLHSNGQHFVPITDAGVWWPGKLTNYSTYTRGHDLGVYINNPDDTEYVGQVWPGPAVWTDWLNPKAEGWWADEVARFHTELPFDGVWIDMNEPSNFCSDSCGTESPPAKPLSPGERDVNFPPYKINNVQGDLFVKTVSTNATQYGGVEHYDVHNIWGYGLLRATNAGLQRAKPGQRPFVIGRSTFAGAGQYAGHWGGDNYGTWQMMYLAIPQALTNALFGIPMFGPDSCGFAGDTSEELCGRWMQQSAFFPFYRNHYSEGVSAREPWRWPSVAAYTREAVQIRYSILPYIYTLFHSAATTGSTVMRAIGWEFPDDSSLFGADRQFLLGPALMVIPVLDEGAVTVNGVLPGDGPWYDWYNQTAMPASSLNVNTTISAPQGHIPLYVRGGYIIPQQEPAYTIAACRKNPWGVLVALDQNGSAQGSLYNDDGESLHPQETQNVYFAAEKSQLSAHVQGHYQDGNVVTPLANVTVMGVSSFGGHVTYNGHRVSSSSVSYDTSRKLLQVTNLEKVNSRGAWDNSWTLAWN